MGYTQTSLRRRIIAHYHMAKRNNSNNYFKAALATHNKEDFIWFIVHRSKDLTNLMAWEAFFIAAFKSNVRDFGYNLTSGGEQSYFTQEVRDKISKKAIERDLKGMRNPFYGKTHSEEQRLKWRESRKGIIHNPGYRHTEETKQKIREIKERNKGNEAISYNMSIAQKSKAVKCITTGEEFRAIKAAARYFSVSSSALSAHLQGKTSNVRGLVFELVTQLKT